MHHLAQLHYELLFILIYHHELLARTEGKTFKTRNSEKGKDVVMLKGVNYFHKKVNLTCLTEFSMRLTLPG